MTKLDANVSRALPLRPVALAVLSALASGPAAGLTILDRSNEAMPGRSLLGPGTLYRLLRELRTEGMIEYAAAPPHEAGSDDERRQYHKLTAFGRAVLHAEAARLRQTLGAAGLLHHAPRRA